MLEVGEYVRYEGIITKAIDKIGLYSFELDNGTFYDPRDITYEGIKHSKDITDLIEKGDYVNGMEIDEFDDVEGNLYLGFPIYDDGLMNSVSEFRPLDTVEIKTILTKEQYERNCYKIN